MPEEKEMMCRKRLVTALRRILPFKPKLPRAEKVVVVGGNNEELAREFERLTQKYLRSKRLATAVGTSRGGPNMPKYQPCPRCHGGAKRQEKMGDLGARYFCRRDQASFVVKA